MKIRSKISLYLGPFILIVVSAIFILNYHIVRRTLTKNAQLELAKIEQNTHRAAEAILSTAINNYLRGITEKNMDFIEETYAAYRNGRLTEQEAKGLVQIHFNLQSVGTSGYLVAVKEMNDKLYLDLHPYLPKQECTDTEGCRSWARTRNGYTEYDWKNPSENSFRKKAAYVQEFPPWNWIVGASSYRDEFVKLVNIEDLRNLIGPIRINKTGYFFVFNEENTVLIHPEFKNIDGNELVNSKGESILQLLKESKDGYLTYLWKNPSKQQEELKYAFIDKLAGYNWYLVATGYLSEVYAPIAYLKNLTTILVLLACAALFIIIFRLSRNITIPLLLLEQGVSHFYANQTPFRWQKHPIDEINVLGIAFSRMTAELNHSMLDLQAKNAELAISEREKEESRTLLDSIINSMPSVIIGIDPHMKVTQWNSQAEHATSFSLNEVRGQSLFAVFPDLEPHTDTLRDSLASNEVRILPHSQTDPEGTTHYSEITVYPLVTPGNEGAVIRIDEVTDRVEMEQRLRQSQKMDAIGQLAGGVAHDFNNMLSGITGATELLHLKVRPEEQNLVKIISEASGRAGELIQKLLAFSRKEIHSFTPVDMHIVIKDTIEILKRTLDKRVTIEAHLLAESMMVMGDWSQLQNCLLNIGINAGHAMPEGGTLKFTTDIVTLDEVYCAEAAFDLTPGRFLQITVRDTGCGISQEHLKRIFEPFFTTREQNKGTGLGLAAVYGAVQQHRGAIAVYSEQNNGTEFSITLPLSLSQAKPAMPLKQETLITGEGCVLVIDDESLVRTTARMMLEKLGYTTLEAEDGKEGIEIYRQHRQKIALVMLDMLMPVMDGTQCFSELKKIDPQVRVIITSGFTRDADLSTLKAEGLCDFVRKPYNMKILGRAIAQALAPQK